MEWIGLDWNGSRNAIRLTCVGSLGEFSALGRHEGLQVPLRNPVAGQSSLTHSTAQTEKVTGSTPPPPAAAAAAANLERSQGHRSQLLVGDLLSQVPHRQALT